MRENRMSGSMRGCWALDMAGLVRHRQTKGAGTDRPDLPSGYQALLYPFRAEPRDFARAWLQFFGGPAARLAALPSPCWALGTRRCSQFPRFPLSQYPALGARLSARGSWLAARGSRLCAAIPQSALRIERPAAPLLLGSRFVARSSRLCPASPITIPHYSSSGIPRRASGRSSYSPGSG